MRAPGTRGDRIRGAAVTVETVVAAVVSLVLLVYLVYTLLRPEQF